MKVGLVGLPGSGKSTVFEALTGLAADPAAQAKSRAQVGSVKVPDHRVDALAALYEPKKTTYAEVVFSDLAGARASAERRSLDSSTIQAMRDLDALCQVLRCFDDATAPAPADPLAELADFALELTIADLALVERRLERLKKEKGDAQEVSALEQMREHLESELPLRCLELRSCDWARFAGFQFLTRKPRLLVLNVDESAAAAPPPPEIAEAAAQAGLGLVCMSAKVEAEIAQLSLDDQLEFLESLGLAEPAKSRFIVEAYRLLDLISFLTAGPDECRAWTIKRGTPALKAAGKIHSDIERGFIRAEVVRWDDLTTLGSEAKCREAGKLKVEGKEYVVADGDVVHFRFNV